MTYSTDISDRDGPANVMSEHSEDATESSDDGEVLSPNELDISDDESVVEIDDGRYVISPGGGSPTIPEGLSQQEGGNPGDSGEGSQANVAQGETLDLDSIHDSIEAYLSQSDSKYAFDVTASFEGRSAQKALFSNDVVTTFENLVVWYAHHAGGETPVEEVIGILLMESNVTVRYPAESVRALADLHDLSPDDSIEDLLEAADDAGGITFLPNDR